MSATGTFEYFETLGEGVAGIVYRAKDPKGREVAVKLLREVAAKNPDLLRRFRREVDVATSLEHENLVLAYEGGQTAAGRLYLSSELVRGANAARLLDANRPLAEPAALSIGRDVARALAHLRAQKLVHRDAKPENVLVRADGLAKLSDFGLARSAAEGGARLTATGEVLGTPYYLAPEQIHARKDVDVRADLYSLGCMMHEWLAGKRPFDGASVVEILAGHVKREAPDLSAARPGLEPRTVALVRELLEKDREKRPQDPEAVGRRLDEILAALGAGDGRAAVREALARVPAAAPAGLPGAGARSAVTLTSADAVAAEGRTPRWRLRLGASRSTLTLFVFAGDRLQLGRDAVDKSQNDVCLRVRGPGGDAGSRKISGSHLRLELDAKGAIVKDLETTGGTRVNGVKLEPRVGSPVRSSARVDVAQALELELRVVAGEGAGAPPSAVLIMRTQNSPDQAYALVRGTLLLDGAGGEPRLGGATGTLLAFRDGAFLLGGEPLKAGATVKASGLVIEAAEIRPEDMK